MYKQHENDCYSNNYENDYEIYKQDLKPKEGKRQ